MYSLTIKDGKRATCYLYNILQEAKSRSEVDISLLHFYAFVSIG